MGCMKLLFPFETLGKRCAVSRRSLFRYFILITVLATSIHLIRNIRQGNDNEGPVKHIAYLRTPKTGSSTMTCILRRFAVNHNLTVYSPKKVLLEYEKQQRLLDENKKFDMFTTHTIYDHFFFTHIVPRPVIIGLVREPLQQAISSFFYNNYQIKQEREAADNDRLANFIKDLEDNNQQLNAQSKFFGMKQKTSGDSYRTTKFLNKLNREFSLVLVLERFNESLVLMKRLLKWSFFDILYGKRKVNNYDVGSLDESKYAVLKKANRMDIEVYDFFYKQLEKKIKAAGDNFREEVKFFEYVLEMASAFCNSVPFPQSKYVFNISKWEDSFSVTGEDCNSIFVNDVWRFKSRFDDR